MRRLLALIIGAGLSLMAGITVGDTELKHIVVDAKAAPTAKLAASNLQEFVQKVSGAKLDIVSDAVDAKGNIFVGEREELVGDLKPEGYRIVAKDGNLYITGRDSAGVVYGIRNPWRRPEVYNDAMQLGAFGEAGTVVATPSYLTPSVFVSNYNAMIDMMAQIYADQLGEEGGIILNDEYTMTQVDEQGKLRYDGTAKCDIEAGFAYPDGTEPTDDTPAQVLNFAIKAGTPDGAAEIAAYIFKMMIAYEYQDETLLTKLNDWFATNERQDAAPDAA